MDLDGQMKQMQRRLEALEGNAPKPAPVADVDLPRLEQIDRALHELVDRVAQLELANSGSGLVTAIDGLAARVAALEAASAHAVVHDDQPKLKTGKGHGKKRHDSDTLTGGEQSDT